MPPFPILNPDSRGYLANAWSRAPGYPLFLDLVQWLTGSWRWLIVVQATLGAATKLLVCFAIFRFTRSLVCTALVGGLILLDATPYVYDLAMISESLFVSILLLHIALGLLALVQRSSLLLIFYSLSAAACAFIRPPGLATVPGLIVIGVLLVRAGHRRALVCSLVPCLLALVVWSGWNSYRFGASALMLRSGVMMFGNVGHLLRPGSGGDLESLAVVLAPTTASFRAELSQASGRVEREHLAVDHYERLVGRQADRLVLDALDEFVATYPERACARRAHTSVEEYEGICKSRLKQRLASRAILHDPAGYFVRSTTNLVSFWALVHKVIAPTPRGIVANRYERPLIGSLAEQLGFPHRDLLLLYPDLDRDAPPRRLWLARVMDREIRAGGGVRRRHVLAFVDAIAVAIALVMTGANVVRPRGSPAFQPILGAAVFALPLFGIALVSSMTHFAMARYAHVLHPVAIGATVLTIWALLPGRRAMPAAAHLRDS